MLVNGSVKLDIPLNNGVYALPSEGGVGKSYIYQVLSMAIDKGYPVATVSYNHGLTIFGNVDTAKVIFFDRFDLYSDKFSSSTIGTLGNRAVVLLDMKNLSYLRCGYSFALVNYTKAGEICVDADNN